MVNEICREKPILETSEPERLSAKALVKQGFSLGAADTEEIEQTVRVAP
jgi:hypothetical protein